MVNQEGGGKKMNRIATSSLKLSSMAPGYVQVMVVKNIGDTEEYNLILKNVLGMYEVKFLVELPRRTRLHSDEGHVGQISSVTGPERFQDLPRPKCLSVNAGNMTIRVFAGCMKISSTPALSILKSYWTRIYTNRIRLPIPLSLCRGPGPSWGLTSEGAHDIVFPAVRRTFLVVNLGT